MANRLGKILDGKDALQREAIARDSYLLYQDIGITLEDGYDAAMLEALFDQQNI